MRNFRIRLVPGLFSIAVFLFLAAFPAKTFAWTQQIINAAYAVANNTATPEQRALAFINNKAINQMGLAGKIPDRVYQANQSSFKALNDGFVQDAAYENGFQANLQRTTPGELPKPGTDTDALVETRMTKKPITLKNISDINESYNRKVNEFLRKSNLPENSKMNWARQTDTDFMPVPSHTTPKEFSRIAAHTNKNGGTMYTDPRAAEVEAKLRSGQKITVDESNNYVKEMQRLTNEKLAQADEMDNHARQIRANSPNEADALEAEAQLRRSQAGKYIERIDKVGSRIAQQNGVEVVKPQGPAAESISKVSHERSYETRPDAANVGALGEHSLSKSTQAYAENLANIAKANPKLSASVQRAIAESASGLSPAEKGELIVHLEENYGRKFSNGVSRAMKDIGKKPAGLFDNHPVDSRLKPYFSGETGRVTEFLENHGGKVTLFLTAAQTLSCLNQGKTIGQCAMELVQGAGIGMAVVAVIGPTGATILGGVAGAYQIYEGVVEATKQWADAQQRKAAYENRDKQTQKNLEDLDKYVKDFREKKIYGELQESAQFVLGSCGAVNAQVKSVQADQGKIKSLTELVSAIKAASAECSNAKSWSGEIVKLQSDTKVFEDKIVKGLDWARAKAEKCESPDDAAKIKSMYDNCTGLSAKVKGYSMVATEKNGKINSAKKKGIDAVASLGTAQALSAKIDEQFAEVVNSKNRMLPRISDAIEKKKVHLKLADAILADIDQLRRGFPDKMLPANEKKFDELRALVAKMKTLSCDPETMGLNGVLEKNIDNVVSQQLLAHKYVDEASRSVESCRDIAPADKETDTINASANWVLTAIGMNEDLPKKADQCIAKINAQRKARIASLKCPANSSAVWSEQKKDAQCQCSKGYKWEASRNSCLIDKAAQVAAADCSKYPNSRPYWDEKDNQARCMWCNPGFKWRDAKSLECVDEKAELISKADCSNHPGSRPYWDDKEKQVRCIWCNPGYEWRNGSSTECVPNRATQVANADCSGTPNSRPYWDDKYNDVRCSYCNPGYHFKDSAGTDCEADDSGPNFNNLNLTNAIQQINNANQNYRDETNRINNQWNEGRQNLNRQKEHNAFCDNYARTAVQKFQESVSRGCGYSDRRWQDSYENHYGWCVTASKESADSETRAREAGLQNCAANAQRQRKERQDEIQGLRDKIAGWENGLKCLEEGKRKFPKMELNCNGNFLLGSRDGEIQKLRNAISDGKNRLRTLSSSAY